MLDIGWSELLVIAVILIVVVGPKDLPPMLRAFGKMTTRLRKTAGEFRSQFDEALREAELDDLRSTVNDVRKLNPAESLREAINPLRQMGQDIKADLQKATRLDRPVDAEADEDNHSILPDIADLASEPPAELRLAAPAAAGISQAPATAATQAGAPAIAAHPEPVLPASTAVSTPTAPAPVPAQPVVVPPVTNVSVPSAAPVATGKVPTGKAGPKKTSPGKAITSEGVAPATSKAAKPKSVAIKPVAKAASKQPTALAKVTEKAPVPVSTEATKRAPAKPRKAKSEDRA